MKWHANRNLISCQYWTKKCKSCIKLIGRVQFTRISVQNIDSFFFQCESCVAYQYGHCLISFEKITVKQHNIICILTISRHFLCLYLCIERTFLFFSLFFFYVLIEICMDVYVLFLLHRHHAAMQILCFFVSLQTASFQCKFFISDKCDKISPTHLNISASSQKCLCQIESKMLKLN